jgi:hypothetical protein
LWIGDVADKRDRSVANFVRDLFNLFRSARSDGDTDALARKGARDRATNASAAASYQGCFNHG